MDTIFDHACGSFHVQLHFCLIYRVFFCVHDCAPFTAKRHNPRYAYENVVASANEHTCAHIYIYIYMYTNMHNPLLNMYIDICIYIYIYNMTYTNNYRHVYMYEYMFYLYMHIYMYVHIYTRTQYSLPRAKLGAKGRHGDGHPNRAFCPSALRMELKEKYLCSKDPKHGPLFRMWLKLVL